MVDVTKEGKMEWVDWYIGITLFGIMALVLEAWKGTNLLSSIASDIKAIRYHLMERDELN